MPKPKPVASEWYDPDIPYRDIPEEVVAELDADIAWQKAKLHAHWKKTGTMERKEQERAIAHGASPMPIEVSEVRGMELSGGFDLEAAW